MSLPFVERSRRGQLRVLRGVAEAALAEFGIVGAALRVVNYDFNATYRVDAADGRRFALRINVNSDSEPDNTRAETAWVAALAESAVVTVPVPLATEAGSHVVEVPCAPLERTLTVVVYTWLDGPVLGDNPTLRQLMALGAAMARLHDHVEAWTVPRGTAFKSLDTLLLGVPDNLIGLERPYFLEEAHAVIREALARMYADTGELFASAPRFPIHGDMHPWNAIWLGDDVGVFDFDDAGYGLLAQDLSISLYYLRDAPRREEALLEGYESVRSLPRVDPAVLEALIASRNVLLLNDVVMSVTAGLDDFLPGYVDKTVGRMRHYLETGRFEL